MPLVVVFDLHDTLYLERDFVRGGFAAVGASLATHRGVSDFEAQARAEAASPLAQADRTVTGLAELSAADLLA